MKPNEIVQLVLRTIQKNNNSSRSTAVTSQTPIAPPVMSYAAQVIYDGSPFLLPSGWSVTYNGTGSYTLTHNLGTDAYVAVGSPILSTTLPIASVTPGLNSVDVTWTDTLTSAASDTTFTLLLTQINNRKTSYPLYNTTG